MRSFMIQYQEPLIFQSEYLIESDESLIILFSGTVLISIAAVI